MISVPMDHDSYNNNINVLKTGIKRKANSGDLQPLQVTNHVLSFPFIGLPLLGAKFQALT